MPAKNRWLLTRDFSLIWWSQVLSQVADGVSRLALLWFVYSVTALLKEREHKCSRMNFYLTKAFC
jgi:hypothetical protein